MKDEERTFILERFYNEAQKDIEEYRSLSEVERKYYREGCKRHPEWTHKQVCTYACILSTYTIIP